MSIFRGHIDIKLTFITYVPIGTVIMIKSRSHNHNITHYETLYDKYHSPGEPIIAIHCLIKCNKQRCTDIFYLIISSVDIYLPNRNRSYSQRLRGVLTSQC